MPQLVDIPELDKHHLPKIPKRPGAKKRVKMKLPPPPPPVLLPKPLFKDSTMLDEEGRRTQRTMPVQEMTRASYNRELAISGRRHAYTKILKTMPIDDLKFALAANDSPKALAFLSALMDPRNAQVDIADIAVYHKISLNELMQIWRSDRLTLALGEIFTGAPEVARDTVEDAKSTEICCPRCDGSGDIQVTREDGQAWIKCVGCKGTGVVRRAGDAKSREHVLRATSIIKPDQGTTININSQTSAVESIIEECEDAPVVTVDVDPA